MKNIVTIANTFLMGKALERIYKYFHPACCNYYHLTFQQVQSHLSSELFHETDLFLLELFKNYDGKFRAEGVTAGEKIVGKAKQILIISPLSLPEQFDTLFYWDVKSKIDLKNKIKIFLKTQKNIDYDFPQFMKYLEDFLEIPTKQH